MFIRVGDFEDVRWKEMTQDHVQWGVWYSSFEHSVSVITVLVLEFQINFQDKLYTSGNNSSDISWNCIITVRIWRYLKTQATQV